MADITVDTTGHWGDDTILSSGSFSALAWNDTVTINSGAVCTIDPSAQTPTGADVGVNITCVDNFSQFIIDTRSETSAFVFYGPDGGTLRVESGCTFQVLGDDIQIGTGDGTEGQTISGWTATAGFNAADEPASIEVETGNGTGIYEQWLNIGDLSVSTIGVGELGKWYSYNNSTGVITFGNQGKENAITSSAASGQKIVNVTDGTDFSVGDYVHLIDGSTQETAEIDSISSNQLTMVDNLENSYTTSGLCRGVTGGNVVPNGAKIRVYNAGVGSKTSGGVRSIHATYATRFELDTNAGGIIDWSKLYGFGFYAYARSAQGVTIDGFSELTGLALQTGNGFEITGYYKGLDRYITTPIYGANFNNITNSTATNCKFANERYQNYGSYCAGIDFVDCELWCVDKNATSDASIYFTSTNTITFDGCKLIGGRATASSSSTFSFIDCTYSDSANGEPTNSSYRSNLLYFPAIPDVTVDNLSLIPDGYHNENSIMFRDVTVLKNSTIKCTTSAFGVYSPFDYQFLDSTIVGGGNHISINACNSLVVKNVQSDGFESDFGAFSKTGVVFKGVAVSTLLADTTLVWGQDSHFYEIYDSATTGAMGIFFLPKSPSGTGYATSGDVRFTMNGRIYIVSVGGSIEYTWPHWIKGITEFPSGGSVWTNGSGTANFALKYKIDTGSGYGASWQDLNHTNLSAETIDADVGFRFKLQISHVAGSTSDYLNRLGWDTTVDYDTYPYPAAVVDVVLENVADGSTYWVKNTDTGLVLGSGVQSGTGDITISGVEYSGSDETLEIRVRKATSTPLYKDFNTNATLTSSGARAYVAQVSDE
jgi:hypothetical protein